MIPDCIMSPVRKRAILNRGKLVTYREFSSESVNLGTGAVTPVFFDKRLMALISGVSRVDDGFKRTFRFMAAEMPEYPPSRKSVIRYNDQDYNIVEWQTSQHEDVVDVVGVAP